MRSVVQNAPYPFDAQSYTRVLQFAGVRNSDRLSTSIFTNAHPGHSAFSFLRAYGRRPPHLAAEPGQLLLRVAAAVVLQVRHHIQPEHKEPVGHEVQVEHGGDAQLDGAGRQDAQGAQQEVVGGHALHRGWEGGQGRVRGSLGGGSAASDVPLAS